MYVTAYRITRDHLLRVRFVGLGWIGGAPDDGSTRVTVICENIPPGVRPEDNEIGRRETLEKLTTFLGG